MVAGAGGEDEKDDGGECHGEAVEGEPGAGRAGFGGGEVLVVADVVDGGEGEREAL